MMVSKEYSRFVQKTVFEAIPDQAVKRAKQCLIDWLGCVTAAIGEPSSLAICNLALEMGGEREAAIAGQKLKAPSFLAAFANGMMAHTVESDDIYKDAIYHPGAPVIAAALATAEKVGANGQELLRAIIMGYEVSNRIGKAVNPSHYRYFHTTGTVGTFGAAIAAAVLLGLTEEQIIACLGLAGTSAAGLWEANGTNGKPFHAGQAAKNGVWAALLASKGISGPAAIVEGSKGFMKAMSQSEDLVSLISGLGEEYTIIKVTTKYYGSCGHTFAPIDATLNLIKKYHLKAADIEKISIQTYTAALNVAGNPQPGNVYQSKFSIPYCVAVAIKFGKVFREEFQDKYLADPEIKRLMSVVELQVGQEMEEMFPVNRSASVEITTPGEVFRDRVNCRKGDPDNPLTDEEFYFKFSQLSQGVLDEEKQKYLMQQVLEIEKNHQVDSLLQYLC